jgi:hypothetical protein
MNEERKKEGKEENMKIKSAKISIKSVCRKHINFQQNLHSQNSMKKGKTENRHKTTRGNRKMKRGVN